MDFQQKRSFSDKDQPLLQIEQKQSLVEYQTYGTATLVHIFMSILIKISK